MFLSATWLLGATLAAAEPVDFTRQVQPILRQHCLKCHGPDKQESNLRVDRRSSLLRGGDFGEPAIEPGKSAESFLVKLVAGDDPDTQMPPAGERLSKAEVAVLRAWIDQGAKMPQALLGDVGLLGDDVAGRLDLWSFQPVRAISPPRLNDPFADQPVDAFILRKLVEKELTPSPRADRRTRIRRLYLVMHGLPPTQDEVEQFVRDDLPDAWQRLVDRVLKSPRYGERWARHWLDLVRFGETHGFETNRERPHAWPFRDYVIESFNTDKPYDQFVREQIAGDALGEPVGTGFLVAGPYDLVKGGGNLAAVQRMNELDDMINATGTTFLGLTLGCARCHNHKFDPVTQVDYYSLQAIFAGVNHADRTLPVPADAQQQIGKLGGEIAALTRRLERFLPRVVDAPAADASAAGKLRPAVNAKLNIERFDPVRAKFVRFTIQRANQSQPCIDELEIFSGDKNVALATAGAKATSSGDFVHPLHKLEHLNDGRFGNARSWIAAEPTGGWVQIEFAETVSIDRIEWARDREGVYSDRLAIDYRIECAVRPGDWQLVASSRDRAPFGQPVTRTEPVYDFSKAPSAEAAEGKQWLARLNQARLEQSRLRSGRKVYAGTFSQPGPTHRLYRGEPDQRREVVGPNAVAAFTSLGLDANSPEQERRVALANWIASEDNPLTARVIVNRLWQHHFGEGLVDTPSDFGANGTRPTHPDLLDWLAQELTGNGWSLKHVHRVILMSSTWQQDSRPRTRAVAADASTRLLWRFPPRRLEAEAIRDSIVAVSGVLNLRMGGPGFSGFEVQPENVRHYFPKKSYGPGDWRRMVYMTKVRQEQESVFGAFDCPDGSQVVAQRSRSTTPLQAFNLLNSTFVLQQAQRFADRLAHECPNDEARRARRAFSLAYGRPATDDEAAAARAFALQHGWPSLCRAILNANEFVFIP